MSATSSLWTKFKTSGQETPEAQGEGSPSEDNCRRGISTERRNPFVSRGFQKHRVLSKRQVFLKCIWGVQGKCGKGELWVVRTNRQHTSV